jgi:hypothetical protein
LCEIDDKDLQPLTVYPNPDAQPPSALYPPQQQRSQRFRAIESAALLGSQNDNPFGKLAQAVSLIDQILRFMRDATENEHSKHQQRAELAELDNKIRGFLALIMEEECPSNTSQAAIATAVALSIR